MSPHLLVWMPHYLLDILCVMVEDTGTLILLPLFHHWIGREGEREGGREGGRLLMKGAVDATSFTHRAFLLREFQTLPMGLYYT